MEAAADVIAGLVLVRPVYGGQEISDTACETSINSVSYFEALKNAMIGAMEKRLM